MLLGLLSLRDRLVEDGLQELLLVVLRVVAFVILLDWFEAAAACFELIISFASLCSNTGLVAEVVHIDIALLEWGVSLVIGLLEDLRRKLLLALTIGIGMRSANVAWLGHTTGRLPVSGGAESDFAGLLIVFDWGVVLVATTED